MPFEIITPIVQNVTTTGTTLGCEVRTTSTSSISGNETSYLDEGFESIAIGDQIILIHPEQFTQRLMRMKN